PRSRCAARRAARSTSRCSGARSCWSTPWRSKRKRCSRMEGWAVATEPKAPAVEEVHILWISEGMSCDGDSVSITAADQPAIEDVLLGAIPGIPKVHLHNKVLSPTLGGE